MQKIVKEVMADDIGFAIKLARALMEAEDPRILKFSYIYRIEITSYDNDLLSANMFRVEFRLKEW